MKEFFEFSILEKHAQLVFAEGESKGGVFARRVCLEQGDPRIARIAEIDRNIHRSDGGRLFYSFDIRRIYSNGEIENAELFHLIISPTSYFDPAGEECGTLYDSRPACDYCGSGALQAGPLILQPKRIPKGVDIAVTIAGEIVVSKRMGDTLNSTDLVGLDLSPVFQWKADELVEVDWYQWTPVPPFVEIVSPTKVASSPFDDDADNAFRCPNGDNLGLNLISEVSISAASVVPADFLASRQFIGRRLGLLRPTRVLFLTQKARGILNANGFRGFTLEVARLV
jgi:hypothetical protein